MNILLRIVATCLIAAAFAQSLPADDLLAVVDRFQPMTDQPVFAGDPGQWDAKIRERGWILKEGDLWRLWYTGFDPNQQPPLMKLGCATSSDGL